MFTKLLRSFNHFNIYKYIYMFVFFCTILFSINCCMSSTEEQLQLLETYLSKFKNKTIRDVINVFGQPTSYSYHPYILNNYNDNKTQNYSALMIYDYRKTRDCILIFEYDKKTMQILNSYYQGNCFLIR